MAEDNKKQWRCNECNEISLETDLLVAQSPFDKNDDIVGCPLCLAVDGLSRSAKGGGINPITTGKRDD